MKFPQWTVRVATIVALASALLVVPTAHGVDGESITLSPTDKHYSFDPGATIDDTLTVINNGSAAYTFVVYARPYSVKNSDYEPSWDILNNQTDAYSWVKFQQSSYELQAGATLKVPYTISVPKNASSGGHYGVIFAQTQPKSGDKQSVVRQKRVGTILYATVSGDNRLSGELLDTETVPLQTKGPLRSTSRIKNDGNVDFIDSTTFVVRDLFANQKYSIQRDLTILPNTTRNVQSEWPGSSIFGLYKITVEHSFLGKKSSTTHLVLMMPLWLIISVLLIILIGTAYGLRRRIRKHTARRHGDKKA